MRRSPGSPGSFEHFANEARLLEPLSSGERATLARLLGKLGAVAGGLSADCRLDGRTLAPTSAYAAIP